MLEKKYILSTLDSTADLAKAVASVIVPDFVITLNGDLGVGKTTFTRYLIQSLGVTSSVKSPTFTIVEPYILDKFVVYHFDLYRFEGADEWFDSGMDEYFDDQSICIIEWANKAQKLIPKIDWEIIITANDDFTERLFKIVAHTNIGKLCLNKLITQNVI